MLKLLINPGRYLLMAVSFFIFSCSSPVDQHHVLSDKEMKDGWKLLFDGKTMKGWHLYNQGDIASAWSADSGALVCNPHAKNVKHGDLITDKTYGNFDLSFEWKISKAGNSGVFINVKERPDLGTTFLTGPEYQLLDDRNMDPDYVKDLSHKAAAIFGVIPNTMNTIPLSADWNQSRILQQNGEVTFWLNGVKTISIDLRSDAWKKAVAESPLGQFPEFGKTIMGYIALQDWTNGISFRDMKIKEM